MNLEKLKLCFDKGGNIYFKYCDKYYDLNIEADNKIKLEILPNYNCVNLDNIKFGELKLSSDSGSLRGKVQKEIIKSSNNDETDEDYHERLFMYENEEFAEFYGLDSDEEQEEQVKFVGNKDNIDFCDFDDESNIALYDTLLYDNDNLYFKTSLIGIEPSYRLKIYKDGSINFRPIGDKEQVYTLNADNDNLWLVLKI
ncbi:hypothetical protein Catovirus_2_155 [Catovirus CTV1]|uniref:Uncharacterized protein n=1 Tax=Catovirus CTV1 TaxID=1977631 RepID=A0A1V0SBX5_9VIRU|nr:hypothetical protein Catovirus_2_155 [Catovirus CTV1]